MRIDYSDWHPFDVERDEGCYDADGHRCTIGCREPCEPTGEVDGHCDALGCYSPCTGGGGCDDPSCPGEGYYNCLLSYVMESDPEQLENLPPGRYMVRVRAQVDYYGEVDEEWEFLSVEELREVSA